MMLRHTLKSVPVVEGDQVVGIVARCDLLRLIARGDHDIRAELERRLKEELDALQRVAVEVADGVVTGPRHGAGLSGWCDCVAGTRKTGWMCL